MAAKGTACEQEIVPGILRLYAGKKGAMPLDSNTTNNAEFGAQIYSEPELGNLVGQLLAREPLDETGDFYAAVDDRQYAYAGGKLQIVLEVNYFSPMQAQIRAYRSAFLHVADFQPIWNQKGLHWLANSAFELSQGQILALMKAFDVWCFQVEIIANEIEGDFQQQELHVRGQDHLSLQLPISHAGRVQQLVQEPNLQGSKKSNAQKFGSASWLKQLRFEVFKENRLVNLQAKVLSAISQTNERKLSIRLALK